MAGLRVPATALRPARIETRINPAILKSSYRPARDDYDNLKKDFGRRFILPAKKQNVLSKSAAAKAVDETLKRSVLTTTSHSETMSITPVLFRIRMH